MPTTRKTKKPAKTTKAKTKSAAKRKSAPASPLVQVARRIGTTLGEVAVRTGIVKPGGGEPSAQ